MLASEPFNPGVLSIEEILRPRMRSREVAKTEFKNHSPKNPSHSSPQDCKSLRATLSQVAIDNLHQINSNSEKRNQQKLYFKSASLTVKRDRYSVPPQ